MYGVVRGVVYLLLLGQIWVGVIVYCNQIIEKESVYIESKNLEDNQPVDEDNNEKKDDNIKEGFLSIEAGFYNLNRNMFHYLMFNSSPILETGTQPPEFLIFV